MGRVATERRVDVSELVSFGADYKELSPVEEKLRQTGAVSKMRRLVMNEPRILDLHIGNEHATMASMVIARHFRKFSDIWKYTNVYRDHELYDFEGNIREAKKQELEAVLPSTYLHWIDQMDKLGQELVLEGIGEVFPNGIQPARLVDPRVTANVPNRESRRWKIVTAAEITKDS